MQPNGGPFELRYYRPGDGSKASELANRFATTYTVEVSHHEGLRGSEGRRLRKKQEPGGLQSMDKSRDNLLRSASSVVLDPGIQKLVKACHKAEHANTAETNADFVPDIKRRQKIDHVSTIFSEPRREEDNTSHAHMSFVNHKERLPDKKHHMKKNFFSEFTEAMLLQSGMMSEKK